MDYKDFTPYVNSNLVFGRRDPESNCRTTTGLVSERAKAARAPMKAARSDLRHFAAY
jgi:hypothetical protein